MIREVAEAIQRLKTGQIVAFPTDTVYGIGAVYSDLSAVQKLYEIKKRSLSRPLIPLIADISQADAFVKEFPPFFEELAALYWPGPLTLVLPKKESVPDIITAGLPTIGLRIPSHPVALALLVGVGEPIVTTSANLSGEKSALHYDKIDARMAVDFILPCEGAEHKMPSTILSLVDQPTILREGPLKGEIAAFFASRGILLR